MMDRQLFIEAIENLKEFAKANGNVIAKDDIEAHFKGVEPGEEQWQLIYGYLESSRITIKDIIIKENRFEALTDQEIEVKAEIIEEEWQKDKKSVSVYKEELSRIKPLTNEQKEELLERAAYGDRDAGDKLAEAYLLKIVKWAEQYEERSVLTSDLIQEGNLILMMQIIRITERPEQDTFDFETELKQNVGQAFEEYIANQKTSSMIERKVLNKVNAINDCAKKLMEESERKPTVEEVAEALKILPEDVFEAIDLTSGNIDYIEIE